MFYDVNWTLNLFFYTEKKYWKYWKYRYLKYTFIGNTQIFKYFKYCVLIPVLVKPNKYRCTWSTVQLWSIISYNFQWILLLQYRKVSISLQLAGKCIVSFSQPASIYIYIYIYIYISIYELSYNVGLCKEPFQYLSSSIDSYNDEDT